MPNRPQVPHSLPGLVFVRRCCVFQQGRRPPQKELENAGKLELAERKFGNYVEGQLWAPFKLEGGKIVKAVEEDMT